MKGGQRESRGAMAREPVLWNPHPQTPEMRTPWPLCITLYLLPVRDFPDQGGPTGLKWNFKTVGCNNINTGGNYSGIKLLNGGINIRSSSWSAKRQPFSSSSCANPALNKTLLPPDTPVQSALKQRANITTEVVTMWILTACPLSDSMYGKYAEHSFPSGCLHHISFLCRAFIPHTPPPSHILSPN